jgi:hypothetical protein
MLSMSSWPGTLIDWILGAGCCRAAPRWLHDPDAEQAFVAAALSSVVFRFSRRCWLRRVNIGADGSLAVDRDFFVDFHDRLGGPARALKVRLSGGDATSEIFA